MEFSSKILEGPIFLFLVRIAVTIGILVVGRWLARFSRSALERALANTGLTESLITLFTVFIHYGILLLSVLLALAILGVPLTTIITVLGVVIIILGIALQESLSNFAATIIFLLFKPFEVGDLIETNNTLGTVKEIEFFNTVLLKADLKVVILPNGKIQDGGIVNYSKKGILRADVEVGISYEDDIRRAKQILEELVSADARVLNDPPPQIVVLELGDSSVNIGVRPFVKAEDYWEIQWDLTEQIKLRFDEEGITIPYPQRDVHVRQSGE